MTKLLCDHEIKDYCCKGYVESVMLDPFVDHQVSVGGVVSYGLSSFGYDIRLSDVYLVFSPNIAYDRLQLVDPKNFNAKDYLVEHKGDYCIIPPNSFCLGVSKEKFNMPGNVVGICLGKSTYSRCGVIVSITPVEPSWQGYLTLEISNTTSLPVKVYSNEGISQVIFFENDKAPSVTYADRSGKYQDQPCYPQAPKVIQVLTKANVAGINVEFASFDKVGEIDSVKVENCEICNQVLTYKERSTDNLTMCNRCARGYLKSMLNEMIRDVEKAMK